jgi:electron transport complex protein RnfD
VRQLWRALHAIPQLLLVQPEQLGYDLAYTLALIPLLVAGAIFFQRDAVLLFAIAFLAGIVCLLALQLARLTFGVPAWIGFKATHPLVASLLIACFFSAKTPAWLAATVVMLFIMIDTVAWPRVRRVMLHPALLAFGVLFLVQRQLGIGFINPFDARTLQDPLLLWYRFGGDIVDPVKLYVGNIPGPIGVTSMAAVLVGATYLWYSRRISLGVVGGFLIGIAATALALRSDPGFQLASGPSLFIAAYIAADRRRVLVPEPFGFLFGLGSGVAAMLLRWYGAGVQSAWIAFLGASVIATGALLVQGFLRQRPRLSAQNVRTLNLRSRQPQPRPVLAPVRTDVPQPVMAAAPARTAYSRSSVAPTTRRFDSQNDPNDLVRQMRRAASRGATPYINTPILLGSLILLNPFGLWLTWRTETMTQTTKMILTAVSVLWYLGLAGLMYALLHR